ncbi:MAG: leucine-rich repeat domain-containing protein, partial [Clostridia bacterium]|nr:leucine-rich repeat domain-containing protein [Clostridia bacterium]
LIACATLALCAVPFAVAGCAENETAYGEWETVTAATCENEGVQMRVSLADPLVTQTRAIPANGHSWNEWETVTAPTCLVAGVETRTCNTCENSDMRAIPALGHEWGDWETDLAADCYSSGTQSRTCLRDESHTEVQTISALGHDFGEWVITRAPTCTAAGVETRYCRNCNKHTEMRSVKPYGHEWSTYVITRHATCTEEGEGMYICANDATHIRPRTVKALGHEYGDWVVSVPATESEEGEDIRVCRRDSSHTQTRTSAPVGSEGLEYTLISDGTEYKVRKGILSGIVYIPAKYNGLPVTKIDDNGFMNCPEIERVVILGNNLKTVGNNAFAMCKKLQSIEFPEGVTTIGVNAFIYCSALKSVSFPASMVTIGGNINIFRYCSALEIITVAEGNPTYKADGGCLIERATNTLLAGTVNAVIPQYVVTIGSYAFHGRDIESVSIPASVERIGSNVFYGCKKLKEVTIENGKLMHMGPYVFAGCKNLERIVISATVSEISSYAFSSWTEEQTIVVKGFASQEEADAAWGSGWRNNCKAEIVYEG